MTIYNQEWINCISLQMRTGLFVFSISIALCICFESSAHLTHVQLSPFRKGIFKASILTLQTCPQTLLLKEQQQQSLQKFTLHLQRGSGCHSVNHHRICMLESLSAIPHQIFHGIYAGSWWKAKQKTWNNCHLLHFAVYCPSDMQINFRVACKTPFKLVSDQSGEHLI